MHEEDGERKKGHSFDLKTMACKQTNPRFLKNALKVKNRVYD
jgi:hypothetical protein